MILINNLMLDLNTDFSDLTLYAAKALKISEKQIKKSELYRKSVDARHKGDVKFCCSVLAELKTNEESVVKRAKNAQIFKPKKYDWQSYKANVDKRPVVVGFGPAGMFAALRLARAGLKPIVLELGGDVDSRKSAVESFFSGGELKENNNVQFGEGGAGTFSDGKLNTGIKDFRCRAVLEAFCEFGAPKKILTDAKPHIGTDILTDVVKNLRCHIISLGAEVRFFTPLNGFFTENGKICGVLAGNKRIDTENVILATGHSARNVFEMLLKDGVEMEQKPFSVGVRIEHLQSDINRALYGKFAEHPALSAADYKLAVHLNNGRGVYTFCMCPGGEVINSSSEKGSIAVNGMSYSKRDGRNANSALLVGINPEDLDQTDIMSGCRFQENIERRAYAIGSGAVPVSTVGEFLFGETPPEKVKATVKPKTVKADFYDIFPEFVCDSLKLAITEFDKKIHGFADKSAVLTAPETRSSSPIRILRNCFFESPSLKGLYPCGEGAGYAGGIMSAAVDGIRVAEALISSMIENA